MARPLEQLAKLRIDLTQPGDPYVPIFYAGDIFHKWNPSPEAINFAIDHLPTGYAIAGNHDLPNHRIEDIGRSAYYTLVKNGVITNMQAGRFYEFSGLSVVGSPWGYPLFPAPYNPKKHKLVALIHDYVWKDGHSHPGAPPEKHATEFTKQLQGYDAAFLGDNHSGFKYRWTEDWEPAEWYTLFNCGCLIPRRSPERHYNPRVGLLMSDGSVREHLLDTSLDKWTDVEEAAELLNSGHMNSEDLSDFIGSLKTASNAICDFRVRLIRTISDKTDKMPPGVREAVLEALGDER